jgi:Phytanoyl-CoA dioxygenase (PhyH)
MLSSAQVEQFIHDGFVRLDGVFSAQLAAHCRDVLWRKTGCDPHDRSTWTRPVVRIDHFDHPALYEAANAPALKEAYDQLVGAGRWHFYGFGTFPIRFPTTAEPGDDGWHFDGSYYDAEHRLRASLASRGRALLQLFLYSDVGVDDAPTRIRVGSHLDVPALLAPAGEEGMRCDEVWRFLGGTERRPQALATGAGGTVYLCHPFLVHAAQRHRGAEPRFISQPPLGLAEPLRLDRPEGELSPVELAIRAALKDERGR